MGSGGVTFLLGPPCVGKSESLRTLQRAQQILGKRLTVRDLDPNVQSTADLFGEWDTASGEWRDGLLPSIVRELSWPRDPSLASEPC